MDLNFKLIVFFVLLGTVACEPIEIEYALPNQKYQLVSYNFFTKDSLFEMQLGKSIGVTLLKKDIDYTKATVQILRSDFVERLDYVPPIEIDSTNNNYLFYGHRFIQGIYRSQQLVIKNGTSYSISASAQGFEDLKLSQVVFQINDFDFLIDTIAKANNVFYSSPTFQLQILDNEQDNYAYAIEIFSKDTNHSFQNNYLSLGNYIGNDNTENIDLEDHYTFNFGYILSSQYLRKFKNQIVFGFNGNKYNTVIERIDTLSDSYGNVYHNYIYKVDSTRENSYYLKISKFNKDFFMHIKSVNNQLNTRENPFSEPNFIISNASDRKSMHIFSTKKLVKLDW